MNRKVLSVFCDTYFMSHILYVNDTAFQAVIKMLFCYDYCATTWRNNCIGGNGSILDFDKVWILLQFGFHCNWDFNTVFILLNFGCNHSFNFIGIFTSIQFGLYQNFYFTTVWFSSQCRFCHFGFYYTMDFFYILIL